MYAAFVASVLDPSLGCVCVVRVMIPWVTNTK
jgi:hypothetical protein